MGLYGVNIVTVLLCGVLNMVLGSFWYGPLFGKQWIKLMGWSKKDLQKGQKDKAAMRRAYILGFVTAIVTAWVIGILVGLTGLYGGWNGAGLGALAWLGLIGTTTLGSVAWEGKSFRLWALNNAYSLLSLMIVGAIMATWG